MSQNFTQNNVNQFCQDKQFVDNLTYVREVDTFLLYDENYKYHKFIPTDIEMQDIVLHWAYENVGKNISMTLIKDMVAQIKFRCYRKLDKLPTGYIAFKDKTLDLSRMIWTNHNRDNYAYHKINMERSEMSMKIPRFKKFLEEVIVLPSLEPDYDTIDLVQQMFGYYLMDALKPEVVFFLVGEGANGKSQLVKLLKEMIGHDYSSSFSIQNLTTNRFSAVNLIGKKVNLCSEEESKHMKSDKFKAMVTHDMIECEKKYGAKMICFEPRTKFLFATNNMPGFDSIGVAIKRRVKIIKFFREIPEEAQDKSLFDKLLKELPGIIEWAIEGAKKLIENDYKFVETKNLQDAYSEFEEVVSSPVQFLRENYVESEGGFIPNDELYEHYRDWCINNGRNKKSSYNFAKDLKIVLKLPSIVKWCADSNKNKRGRQLIPKDYEDPKQTIQRLGSFDEEGSGEFEDLEL